tara:strand:+ start:381 stop:632 length:252 start_codon:yes stop_codon:yes gene_type:complete
MFNWFYEHVYGPKEPSDEVKNYVKQTCFAIYKIQNLIATETLEEKDIRKLNKFIIEQRCGVLAFERMYPGIVESVIKGSLITS